ncbi:MAG: hypothetical protein M0Q22_09885 [Sulfuritalea sp.]|jgi:hypothetical protein|nr:hypothetical protein [Sulfuritalea sp.]
MKLLQVFLGFALLGATVSAFAVDKVTIKNSTDRVLHYKMRCIDTNSGWKKFEAQPGETRDISAASCQRFAFEKGTAKSDGSVETVKYVLQANTWHVMVHDKNKERFDLKKMAPTDF